MVRPYSCIGTIKVYTRTFTNDHERVMTTFLGVYIYIYIFFWGGGGTILPYIKSPGYSCWLKDIWESPRVKENLTSVGFGKSILSFVF